MNLVTYLNYINLICNRTYSFSEHETTQSVDQNQDTQIKKYYFYKITFFQQKREFLLLYQVCPQMPKSKTTAGNPQTYPFCSSSFLSSHSFDQVKYPVTEFQICLFGKITLFSHIKIFYQHVRNLQS